MQTHSQQFVSGLSLPEYPKLRLAVVTTDSMKPIMRDWEALGYHKPNVLVSYYYYEGAFKPFRKSGTFSSWALDSGAFSAYFLGAKISIREYIAQCQSLRDDPTLEDIFSLDVIGDAEATGKNTETMWRYGVPAIPVFHFNQPWSYLQEMAKTFPKIAVGGVARKKASVRLEWLREVFRRVWPCRIHGFGISDKALEELPFHSADSSSWEFGPRGFGNWKTFGKLKVFRLQDYSCEVEWFLRKEMQLRLMWTNEMKELSELPTERKR